MVTRQQQVDMEGRRSLGGREGEWEQGETGWRCVDTEGTG